MREIREGECYAAAVAGYKIFREPGYLTSGKPAVFLSEMIKDMMPKWYEFRISVSFFFVIFRVKIIR